MSGALGVLNWVLVAVGGGAGAVSRWRLDAEVKRLLPLYPYLGIAIVNIVGSLAAGIVSGVLAPYSLASALVSTGFLGGFTTFSTAVMDVWNLIEAKRYWAAVLLLVGVWGIGLLCAALGLLIGRGIVI